MTAHAWIRIWAVFLLTAALAAAASAQGAAEVWPAVSQPALDPAKAAPVSNLTLARDRIRITFQSGTLQFTQPAAGTVFGAAFRGKGKVEMEPPNALERQQLFLHLDRPTLEMEFSEATLSFTDGTFDEIAKQVIWGSGDLGALYRSRQDEREDLGAEIVPKVFARILSGDRARSALFAAELKTSEKGWVLFQFDALNPEEILVGRWADWGGVKRFDTWMSFPAGGRSAAEAYREPLAKDEFVIRSYRIDAAVTSGAELRATSRVTLEPRIEGDRAILLRLDANLRVESVKDANGAALSFFQPRDPKDRSQSYGDYVAVVLAAPAKAGQPLTLEFTYAGKRVVRNMGGGNYFCQSSNWYPTRENEFASRVHFEMSFRYPKRFILVATGNKVSETQDGNLNVSTWKSDLPLAVAGFAFGDYKSYSTKAGSVEVTAYANKEPDEIAAAIQREASGGTVPQLGAQSSVALGSLSPAAQVKPMAEEVANTLRVFEKYFGPYPYKHLSVANLPTAKFYGQGWPSLLYIWAASFWDSTQRNVLGLTDHIGIRDHFRAHEAAHQWWGHRVGWKSYHDQWLSEGFAQFSGNLYVQYRRNENEYLARLRQDRQELFYGDLRNIPYVSTGPIWMGQRLSSSEMRGAYSSVVYNKGGWVLHMLRMMLWDPRNPEPEARFIAMMQEFTKTYHNQPASTEDFKAMVEKHMTPSMDLDGNRRMDWFFNQYVYGTGIPRYEFSYQLQDAGGGRWKLVGQVTQSGVREGWKEMIPLYFTMSGRTARVAFINVSQRVTPFEIPLPVKPEKVAICAKEDLLAEIKQ